MGTLGTQEMIIIFLLALLIFGPKKLPELGKTVAKAMGEFRRASSELKSTWDREMQQIEKETEPIKQAAQDYQDQIHGYNYDDPSHYDYGAYDSGTSDSTATPSTTVGDPATQGAEQPTATAAADDPAAKPVETAAVPEAKAPEGTVAQGSESPAETAKPVAG
ncbi:MAG: twin-arginine translocase TatA/TatE family subunit [Acidobacteria bacterium]|nr:twin-arginine translocase TatA/TatE family subunit [Acidobacteriota bacterium]